MKGILSTGLLLCLILPFAATWKFLSIQLHQVKKEVSIQIRDGKPDRPEVLLKFTPEQSAQLYWEHSKEFEYKGEMYDVIRTEEKGDTVFYWCYWDKKETRLKKSLDNLLTNAIGQGPLNKNTQDHLVSFFKSLYHIKDQPARNIEMALTPVKAGNRYYFSLSSFEPFPPFHPPELS